MAVAGRLEIELVAGIGRLEREMNSGVGIVTKASKQIETAIAQTKNAFASLGLGLGLGAAVTQIIALADGYTKYTAQLKLATTGTKEYATALEDVRRISTLAQADLQATGILYARIKNSVAELGLSQQRVSNITESISLALKASGASATESASAMLQLSQAFGSGVLRGEEFNAVNEAAPRLMKALADGIGVPIGALREMATQGKITSAVMAQALPQALEDLRKEAAKVETIAGAFTLLKNRVMEYVGATAEANGTVAAFSGVLTALANNLQLLANVLLTIAAVKFANWIAGVVTALQAKVVASQAAAAATLAQARTNEAAAATEVRLTAARMAELRASALATQGATQLAIVTNGLIPMQARAAVAADAHAASLLGLAAAQRGASVAVSAGSVVMGALGGPIGLVITALGVAATAWAMFGSSAKKGNEDALRSTEESSSVILDQLEQQNKKLRERLGLMRTPLGELAREENPGVNAMIAVQRSINELVARQNELRQRGLDLTIGDQINLATSRTEYERLGTQLRINAGLKKEIEAEGRLPIQAEWMKKYATNTEKLAAELAKAKKEFGGLIPPEIEKRIREQFGGEAFKKGLAELKKAEEEKKKLRELDSKGWVEKIENDIKEYEDGLRREVAAAEAFHKEQERMRALDAKGWVAYIDAQIDEYEKMLTDLGKGPSNIMISDKAKKDLEEFLDPAKAKSFGDALADGFGKAGSALGKLVVAFEAFGRKQAEIDAARKKNAEINDPAIRAQNEIKLAEMSAQAQISAYGDMAAAAKGFFEAGSSGYKALEAAEKVFRAFELASAIQNMLTKSGLLTTFTGLFVASKATETAATVASVAPALAADAAKGASAAAVGVATQAQGDPYTAWIRMAAMAATMAALGFAVSGSFGGGGGMTAAQRQERQGTGTVLGDPDAKSESLTKSIQEIEKIDRVGLTYTHDMLEALRSIDSAMSNLATLIFRTTGITTGTDIGVQGLGTTTTSRPLVGGLDSLNQSIANALGIGGLVSGILGLWGKTTKEITDAGIRVIGSVGDLIAGIGIQSFANVRTTTSSWFGLSKDESNSTELGAIDPRLLQQFKLIFGGIVDSVESAAKALNIWFPGMSDAIQKFVVDMGDISLKDLKGQELQDALNNIFSTFGDQLALSVLPTEFLDRFAKVGEGAFQTMMRLAAENELVKSTFDALGITLNASGTAATMARLELVQLMGGAEEFAEKTQSYFENFFSDIEQHTIAGANLNAEFARLGETMPTTKDGFRDLVESLDLSTESGQRMFAALMAINEPFAEWADAIVGLDGELHTSAEVLEQRAELEDRLAIAQGKATEEGLARRDELLGAYSTENALLIQAIHLREDYNAGVEAGLDRRRDEMSLEADLAEAQGKLGEAAAIRYALETEGMNDAELASYDYILSLREQIDAARLLADAQREAVDTEADLNKQLFDLSNSEKAVLENNRRLRLAELAALEEKAGLDAGSLASIYRQIIAQEDLNAAADKLTETVEQMASAFGVSNDQIADLIRSGMEGTLDAEGGNLGKQLGDLIVGGIEDALRQQAADQIAQLITDTIVTPALTAIATGGSISEALSQANIEAMIAGATNAMNNLTAIFDDPEFIAAMERMRGVINGMTTAIAGGIAQVAQAAQTYQVPFPFGMDYVPPDTGGGADDAASLLDQHLSMLARKYELAGDTIAAHNILLQQQAIALQKLDPSLRTLQQEIWDLEAAAEAAAKSLRFADTERDLLIQLARAYGNEAQAIELERDAIRQRIEQEWGVGTAAANRLIGMYEELWAIQGDVATAGFEWIKQLQDWLASLQLDTTLSPLTANQRFDFAQQQYVETLLKAQGGDADARAQFTQVADAYLRESLSFYARSTTDYQAIWNAVQDQAQGLIDVGLGATAPATMSDLNSTMQTGWRTAEQQTNAVIAELQSLRTDVANLTRTTAESGDRIAGAVESQTDDLVTSDESIARNYQTPTTEARLV